MMQNTIDDVGKAASKEVQVGSSGPTAVLKQLASLQHEVGALPQLFAAVVEDRNSTMADDIRVDFELALDRTFSEEDSHYSPDGLVDDLNHYRAGGYQFFCIHAEPYRDDPEVAAAEQRLFTLANSPIRPGAVKRNRKELDGWTSIVLGTFENGAFNQDGTLKKEILLAMARLVVFCSSGELPAEPVERMWPAIDADANLRSNLRARYSIGPRQDAQRAASGRNRPQKREKALGKFS